jgi:hypothetical protein
VNSEGLIERVGYYGSELILNGNFATDTNWIKGAGWTISGGEANCNSGSSTELYQSLAVSGKTYKITFTITSYTSGQIAARAGGITGVVRTSIGTFTDTITANGTQLGVFNSGGFVGSIDNVSAVEVTGDRARLNYEIEGGLVNTKPSLLLEPQSTNSFPNSEDYTVFTSASAGTGTNPIITSNYSISPDGTKNADRIQFNRGSGTSGADTSYITKSLSLGTIDATLSIYLKTNDGTTKDVTLRLGAALFDYDVTVTSEWQRFTLSGNTNVDRIQIILYGNQNSQTADLSCFGTQVESLTYATSYIPTNGSTQTRAAETCNGAGTSSILPSEEGILYAETQGLSNTGTVRVSISDGTNSNNTYIELSTNLVVSVGRVGAVNQYALSSSQTITNFNKIAIRYKVNDIALWVNGTQVATDTSANTYTSGTLSQINFDRVR